MWTEDNLMVLNPKDQVARGNITPLMAAADSVGGWGAVLVTGRRGTSGRTHIHRGESEAFFIVEGEVDLCGATSVTPLLPGAFVLVPPDTEHGLRITSASAKWLAIWPSALDGLIEELEEAQAQGRGDPETLDDIRSRHGMEPGGPIAHLD